MSHQLFRSLGAGAAVSSGLASSILSTTYTVITTGIGGVGLLAFWNRWIVPGATLDDVKGERDEWKVLYEREREAHQATRDAFQAASQRGDAGVEAAKVTVALIEALRRADRLGLPPGTPDG
jgi:hypothetical protein